MRASGASRVRALWLNSPFFDWRLPDWKLAQLHVGAALGRFCPVPAATSSTLREDYVSSLLDEEWEFDLELKPPRGFGVYYGWLGAITDAHAQVHRGLAIGCPVLAMHSDEADIVLDWRHIAKWSRMLGAHVAVLAFPGAHARPGAVAAAYPRGSLQAALRLGGTSHSVSSVASGPQARRPT